MQYLHGKVMIVYATLANCLYGSLGNKYTVECFMLRKSDLTIILFR